MIFNHQIAPGRNAAVRAGWNDAAWGQSHQVEDASRAAWYERGYAGGLVYRRNKPSDLAEPTLLEPLGAGSGLSPNQIYVK